LPFRLHLWVFQTPVCIAESTSIRWPMEPTGSNKIRVAG